MMRAEDLARLWQDGLREAYGEGQAWGRLSDQQKAINIRVATKVLENLTIMHDVQWMQDNIWHPQLGDHAACISALQRQVKVLHDEIFCVANTDRSKTLLARVDELYQIVCSLQGKECKE